MIIPRKSAKRSEKEDAKYATSARRCFDEKIKENWYSVSGEMGEGEEWYDSSMYVPLEKEEISLLQKLLSDPEYEYTLEELENEIPFYYKLEDWQGGHFVPKSIDFEHPVHYYTLSYATLGQERRRIKILFTDEEYITLLQWRMQNREDSFNDLEVKYPTLHWAINQRILAHIGYLNAPFLVYLDEVDADVFETLGEPDFSMQVFEDYERDAHTFLNISEKKLEFGFEKLHEPFTLAGVRKLYDDIDAIAVEKALGVSYYEKVGEEFKRRFGGSMEDYDKVKEFLDSNGIAYNYYNTSD